jgi:uroporphyrinogen decarboxylase
MWLMRQAGRYLPEYRKVRRAVGSFLDLCDQPELAGEVTMQPLRRYDLDAAIVFADILLVTRALGNHLDFRDNEGPVLSPVRSQTDMARLSRKIDIDRLGPVFETLSLVSSQLESYQTLIGFCGAPWTVACYMVEGGVEVERVLARRVALESPPWFEDLIEILIEGSIEYLIGQLEAGAEVVQIFDSWAGDLPESHLEQLVYAPVRRIVEGVRKRCGPVPVIGFARGIGAAHLEFAKQCSVNAVSVEQSVPLEWLKRELTPKVAVQGNLDPLILAVGGDLLTRATRRIMSHLPPHSHVFNLGHGVRQETPPEHVAELVAVVREADGAALG